MQYTNHYNSPLEGITLASNGSELIGLWFDGQKYFGTTLTESHITKELPIFNHTKQWLDIYFNNQEPDFIPKLQFNTTPFRKLICEIMLKIPYGQTMTYGEIANIAANKLNKSKMSPQAVGGAVGHNAISIIVPCHRVIGTNKKLIGYAGGIDKKEKLLQFEKNLTFTKTSKN